MARHLIKFRWKTILFATFFFVLGNFVSLFFNPINRKCIPDDQKIKYDASRSNAQTNLIILILSAPNNLLKRNTIRETWWNLNKNIRKDQNIKVKYYFSVGNTGLSQPDLRKLKNEYFKYNDILTLPIFDSYNNLTQKIIRSFEWLIEQSENEDFKYVLKCDDDSFVRIDHLIHELVHLEVIYLKSALKNINKINDNTSPYLSVNLQSNSVSSHENRELYWGYMHGGATVFRKGKWKEPSWISCDRYLPYALGGGYVLSKNLIKYIIANKLQLRYYHSEDVSVGAWLAPINNVVRIHDRRFDTEYVSRGCQNYYLIRHNVSPDEMKKLYSNLQEKQQLCTQEMRTRKEYIYDWSVPPSKCCDRVIE